MTAIETKTDWSLRGTGYEFCNCQPGCTCKVRPVQRLLVDHRETLLQERTKLNKSLQPAAPALHELDPSIDPEPRSPERRRGFEYVAKALAEHTEGVVGRLARSLLERCRQLTIEIDAIEKELTTKIPHLAPAHSALPGALCGWAQPLTGEQ